MGDRIVLSLMLLLISSLILNMQYSNSRINPVSKVFAATAIGSEDQKTSNNEEGQEVVNNNESNKTSSKQSEEASKPRLMEGLGILDTQNKESPAQSEEGSNASGTETNKSAKTPSEDKFNLMLGNKIQESTTTPSNLTSSDQISNQSENASKPELTILDKGSSILEKGLSPEGNPTYKVPTYKVKVTFDSMTVHDDLEGAFSGDGEYDIAAYVQGIKVGLTDASGPGAGLWDVSTGETVYFDPGTEVTVDTQLPLSIFTVGSEVDSCGRTAFPENMQSALLNALERNSRTVALQEIKVIQDSINGQINSAFSCVETAFSSKNDILGVINEVIDITGYGETYHATKSAPGAFTLKYTISVTAP